MFNIKTIVFTIVVVVAMSLAACAPAPTAAPTAAPAPTTAPAAPTTAPAAAPTTAPAATAAATTAAPAATTGPTAEPTWDASTTKSACAPNCKYSDMVMCFPQEGAESDWRTADTASFQDTATKLGIKKYIFSDAQQKQENQIAAVRACIAQGVSVIALPPVVEDGWETVLTEAKNANIPVILIDRTASAPDNLWASHIGSDMNLEGNRAGAVFNKLLPNGGKILEVSGTTGSSAAVGRSQGIRAALNSNITVLDSQTGDFTRAEAKPVVEAFLQKYKPGTDFQGIEFQNDDMGMGGLPVLQAAGMKPGDVKIVSFDGTKNGFQAMVDGWFQADVECNPLIGPQAFDNALKLMNGINIPHEILTNETVYYPDNAAQLLPTRTY
jgi:ABC-type sugar transport system substrate-binding protein